MLDIDALRADTPGVTSVVHLNNAGCALPPRVVTRTMIDHLEREAAIGGYEAHAEAGERIDAVYVSVGELINAPARSIALVESATAAWDRGLQAIVHSTDLGPTDRILIATAEYASNALPLMQLAHSRGCRIETIPDGVDGALDLDALDSMIDDDVAIVSVTHAPSQNGLVNDVVAIGDCLRRHGSRAWYLVDACQSAGQLPLDAARIGCDVLSATGRKFLRGPRGTGFLAVSDRILEEVEPFPLDLHSATWTGPDSYRVADDARRFESWEKSYAAVLGLGAAVDYALALGVANLAPAIADRAADLRSALATVPGVRVTDRGSQRSGIVTFACADAAGLVRRLRDAGINTSLSTPDYALADFTAYGNAELVRVSPHAYNNDADLDRFVDVVTTLQRT